MSLESEFVAAIAKTYEQGGWVVAPPEEAVQQLNFEPDLLLKKGDQHLVIEVKREGFGGSRASEIIKQIVEMEGNWKFETKIIPRNWNLKSLIVSERDVDARVNVAEKLQSEGHFSEAFILFWTTIEASLRRLLGIDSDRDIASSALLREAYEEGVIVDAELRELQAALHIRNRLVHGLKVDVLSIRDDAIQRLAKALQGRPRLDATQ